VGLVELSYQEMRVLQALLDGHTSYDALSKHMGLHFTTIRHYLYEIRLKVGARNQIDLVMYWARHRKAYMKREFGE
jgi:DNA-binding CsgD family transcriptional regulator